MTFPTPTQLLGLPKFGSWYPNQLGAFRDLLDWYYSAACFCGLVASTGSGKSILALLTARMSGARTVILTMTKGLSFQYMRDARRLGAAEVRGQNNFPCPLVPGVSADQGPCHEGLSCEHRQSRCPYQIQLQQALAAPIVVTNYAYWLAQTRFSSGLGETGLLVCDEVHDAFRALESHLTVHLSRMDVEPLGFSLPAPELTADWSQWQSWATLNLLTADTRVRDLAAEIKELREADRSVPSALSHYYRVAKSVVGRLESISGAHGLWVIQATRSGFKFTPRWVNNYGSALFQSVPKVLMMSAILTHKTADSIGVPPEPEHRTWIDVPSSFPAANTPIWHVPTARINYRTDDYGTSIWLARIDQIISRRLDRKGIVFTVSYDRARLLLHNSRYADILVSHSTSDVIQVVDRFKRMEAPAVLVSPSVTTGYDFGEETGVKYIIVGKVPYPQTKDPVLQARHEDDKEWSSFMAMSILIQECGRAGRSATQKCEILCVDDAIKWFVPAFSKFAPKWFMARWRGSLASVPNPLV